MYAENGLYDLSLREQYSKGWECGLMKGKPKGSGRKANSLPGGWAQEECPGHVAGRMGWYLAAPVKGTQLQLSPEFQYK